MPRHNYSPEDWADLRAEFREPRTTSCSDRSCGADDCDHCRPGCNEEEEEE